MFQDFKSEIKLFLIVAIVAIIIAVGGILVLKAMQPVPVEQPTINNQQSEIDTSDWQTYRNDEFGFEVKYPAFPAEDFSVTINDLTQEYEVLPAETFHPQSHELNILALRDRVNTKVLLNSFRDEQKNHFDVYIAFLGKEEGINIIFEYPRNGSLEVDKIALINQILSTFRFVE